MSELNVTAGASGAHGRVILIADEHFLYDTPLLLRTPEAVPQAIADHWVSNTLAHVDDKLVPGWAALLATEDSFLTRLATPAADGYPGFLNPAGVSRRGLAAALSNRLHAYNLTHAYQKMKDAIDHLTGDGLDEYKAALERAAPDYREGEALPLSATGDYGEQILGAAVRQWFFLGLSPKFAFYEWLIDVTEGRFPPDPPFLQDGNKWNTARRHNNLVIQGACMLLSGLSVQGTHDLLDELLASVLREDYAQPPESFIRFMLIDGLLSIRTLIALAG
jgi:hypothetical protein